MELSEINNEVASLSGTLQRLQILVEEERQTTGSGLILRFHGNALASGGVSDIESALMSCKTAMMEIRTKMDHIVKLAQGGPFDRIRYPFSWSSTRKDLLEVRSRLEYSKTSILMSLHLRTLCDAPFRCPI